MPFESRRDGRALAVRRGFHVQVHHVAAAGARVAVELRPLGMDGKPTIGGAEPSGRVMIAVEPPGTGQADTGGDLDDEPDQDGAAVLGDRQHLLLNLFGVNPTELRPETGLELARALDALDVYGRRLPDGGARPA